MANQIVKEYVDFLIDFVGNRVIFNITLGGEFICNESLVPIIQKNLIVGVIGLAIQNNRNVTFDIGLPEFKDVPIRINKITFFPNETVNAWVTPLPPVEGKKPKKKDKQLRAGEDRFAKLTGIDKRKITFLWSPLWI